MFKHSYFEKNWTTQEQILPISLESFEINSSLLEAPNTLKDFIYKYKHKKEVFDLQERHVNNEDLVSNKNSFFNNDIIDTFLFVTPLFSPIIATVVVSVVCKHAKLKAL